VHARHWEQFAEAAGLSWAQTRKRVLRMAQELPGIARQQQALAPFADQRIVARIVALIEQRSALAAGRLLERNSAAEEADPSGA
jgi:serine/threonine-protein kinase HipA